MSARLYTFDTNILFYAIDEQAGHKHRTARALIADGSYGRSLILLQTLAELCNSIRKKLPDAVSDTSEFVQDILQVFDVAHALPSDLIDAIAAGRDHNIPFWDAMLWATARRAGCTLLLSEDFQDGQVLGGVTIRNPFKMQPAALTALLK
jgi:predicted nucleic acid-binding protein